MESNNQHDMHDPMSHDQNSDKPQHENHDQHQKMVTDFKRRFFLTLLLTIPILILSPVIQGFLGLDLRFAGDSIILLALSTALFIYGGKPFLTGAVDELKSRSPAMMTLIAFAITVSFVYSVLTVLVIEGSDFFWELATLVTIMLLGHWIEMRSVMGASMALEELAKLMPDEAHRIGEDGKISDVAVSDLKAGDLVLIRPGEKVPIDAVIEEGQSSVNEAMVTGESVPVEKTSGDEVIGGSVNGDGSLTVKVSRVGDETFLSQVIRMVRQAQKSKSKTQRLADTAAKWLFYLAMSAGLATFAVWLATGSGLQFAVTRAVTVIVICCPHALGLAIPLVTAVSTSIGANRGLLIRDRAAFENARNLTAVVFDKTGTLTQGAFGVTDISAIDQSEDSLLQIAASVEIKSEHLIAQGIVEAARERGLDLQEANEHLTLPGRGIQATVSDRQVMVTSPGYLDDEHIDYDRDRYEQLAEQGKTVVYVLADRKLQGSIALSDIIRDTAREAVRQLKQMEIEPIMLTGDNKKAAGFIASQLGIDRVFAEQLPQDKARVLDDLRREGHRIAMTGDGINDAPSLAKADLGIAIGTGTDVAVETADLILVKSNPLDVISAIRLSRAIYKKMIQNLVWATGYNIIALPLAAGVLFKAGILLDPAIGAVLMSVSTIIVAINARLIKI